MQEVRAKVLHRVAHPNPSDMVSVHLAQEKALDGNRPYIDCVRVRAEVRLFGEFVARNDHEEIERHKERIVRELAHLTYGDSVRALLTWYRKLCEQNYIPRELESEFSKIIDSMR